MTDLHQPAGGLDQLLDASLAAADGLGRLRHVGEGFLLDPIVLDLVCGLLRGGKRLLGVLRSPLLHRLSRAGHQLADLAPHPLVPLLASIAAGLPLERAELRFELLECLLPQHLVVDFLRRASGLLEQGATQFRV